MTGGGAGGSVAEVSPAWPVRGAQSLGVSSRRVSIKEPSPSQLPCVPCTRGFERRACGLTDCMGAPSQVGSDDTVQMPDGPCGCG